MARTVAALLLRCGTALPRRRPPLRRPQAGLPRTGAVAAALLTAPAAGAGSPHEATGLQPTAIPLLSFSSDDGVGYGLRATLFEYDGRTVPYLRKYSAQLYFTSGGRWVHLLAMDTPRFRGADRLEMTLRFEQEALANYYGSLTDGEARLLGRDQKTFSRSLPSLELRWIRRLGPPQAPWGLGLGARFSRAGITPNAEAGNVLSEAAPPGIDGGVLGQVNASVRYDSRDDYNDTSTGLLEELLVEHGIGGGGYSGMRVRFDHRHFAAPVAGLVAAHRLALDWTAGEWPFYEWPEVGGGDTLRGLVRGRDRGGRRVLLNGRAALARHAPLRPREHVPRRRRLRRRRTRLRRRPAGGPGPLAPRPGDRSAGPLAEHGGARRLGTGRRRHRPLPHLRAHVLTQGPAAVTVRRPTPWHRSAGPLAEHGRTRDGGRAGGDTGLYLTFAHMF